ncbi:type II toxin-antitoxin system PemK/MazF family toxin [Paenibacillus sp. USHLN196]|uniref:type II toxin-antitoxin system PemK/MazF family toxin n=1 Tax=Paenibacillus sp. USHLN196 TaxID=3081291 RepID=UPI003016CA85
MNHNRGDVYLVLYPFDDMDSEKGRPAIIIDTRDKKSLVVKVTSKDERDYDDGDIEIEYWEEAGLSKPSVARCSHFIPLDHEKTIRPLGVLHSQDLTNVLSKLYRNL